MSFKSWVYKSQWSIIFLYVVAIVLGLFVGAYLTGCAPAVKASTGSIEKMALRPLSSDSATRAAQVELAKAGIKGVTKVGVADANAKKVGVHYPGFPGAAGYLPGHYPVGIDPRCGDCGRSAPYQYRW